MAESNMVFIDIETSPSLGWYFDPKKEYNILEVDQDWFILSFAAIMPNGDKVVRALCDYKGYDKDKTNDYKLVNDLWKILDGADILVAHNGDSFDFKKINSRFLVHGFTSPSPYKTVDTLKIARKYFKFDSNRLDELGRSLGVGRKVATHGKNTWLSCISGDKKAWEEMKEYNMQDTILLKKVYLAELPWMRNHPAVAIEDKPDACPNCGSDKSQARGWNYTKTRQSRKFQCKDCHSWYSGKSEKR